MTTGAELLAKSLVARGVDTLFFLMAGPMHDAETAMAAHGLRMIDVRHEQAAAMMAHAYGRVMQRPGVCMGGSGPGALNLHGGLANALIDCVPVVALGGSSPLEFNGMGVFQEIDQVAAMRPVTKWAQRVYETRRIPELVATAFKHAMAGKPGPVYLDFPGDILNATVADDAVEWPDFEKSQHRSRPRGDPELTAAALRMIAGAERPIIIYGSGVLWSQAWQQLQNWAECTGIPFYATPQARGCIAEDHALAFPAARSYAFKNADVVLVVGTRMTYGLTFGMPPRFNANAKFIRIDIDHEEIIANPRVEIGINGDARAVLEQFSEGLPGSGITPERFSAWRDRLKKDDDARTHGQQALLNSDAVPIHPMRLCREVRDFMDRDAILVVD